MKSAKPYRQYTKYNRYSELKKLDWIVETVEHHKADRPANSVNILDIGCGKGNISLALASLGYTIHGIDLDSNEISYASYGNTFPNASFEVGDAENINVQNRWDIIICSEILEHLSFPESLTRKLPEVVKRGGIIIVTIPNGFGPYELFYEIPIRLVSRQYNKVLGRSNLPVPSEHKKNFTFKSFSTLMGDSIYVYKSGRSDFLSFWPIIRNIDFLVRVDCKIADLLPRAIVSGWYFACKLK
jgi:2-polyprenyl-3-methyl-5-hydroxy-6-metoxy-1,4-benzoquinol methylase